MSTQTTDLGSNFRLVDATIRRRMVMSIEGDYGTGKTDLALTAPPPIAFFKFDLNADHTLAKWAATKTIYKCEYDIPEPDDPKAKELATGLWTKFTSDYHRAIQSPKIRSIVWDTASEVWEQCRLAAFGKLTNVMPHHYVETNNKFRRLIREAYESDTNLIMIHRLKDEWQNYIGTDGKEKGRKTGRKERAGFSDIAFACAVMVQTVFNPEDSDSPFQARVLKCTQTPQLTGRVYTQIGDIRMNSFPVLASDVFPGTDIDKDWS